MEKRRFRAIPLTPVHIGTGELLTPEDYFIDGDRLVRFNPRLVLHKLAADERKSYENALNAGNVHSAWEIVRRHARQIREARVYDVAIGEGAINDLVQLVEHPDRRGEIRPLPRNPYDGRIVIPGSAIKGAIRTAVANSFVQQMLERRQNQRPPEAWESRVRNANIDSLPKLWRTLEQEALATGGALERDPFRLLAVDDATVDPVRVRVDKVTLLKRGGDPAGMQGVQIHVERLLSCADGISYDFEVSIALDVKKAADPRVSETVSKTFDWKFLIDSCNYFFINRLNEECETFPSLYAALKPKSWQPPEGGFILRIGRFSHYESLSFDRLRRNENRATGQAIFGMGSTRAACELAGGAGAPFGWIKLEPLE